MEFRVLGPLEVLEGGQPLPLGGTKQRAVLSMLLLRANAPVAADVLTEAVWGDQPPERARPVLQVYVANLRRVLEPDRGRGTPSTRIATAPDGYRLRVGPDELDADRFYRFTREARAAGADATTRVDLLAEAERLWRGPPLPDLVMGIAQPEVTRWAEDHLTVVEERMDAELERGRHAEVVSRIAGLVEEHPLRERLCQQLVLALYRCGRHVEALARCRAAREELAEELGLDPSASFRSLEQAVLRQDPALDPMQRPMASHDLCSDSAGRLPVAPNPLVGRARDLAELAALLRRPDVRLLTLHGAGGSGKTRLAVAAAARVADDFTAGVRFVPLAALTDPELVLPAVGSALGVRREADQSLADALRKQVGDGRVLAVLDNLEQLVQAGPAVAHLLEEVPGLTVMATSRATLRLRAELTYPVLPLPPEDAAALFLARARVACPRGAGHGPPPDIVDAICRRLDHLPLAIELAAARLRTVDAVDLLARLDRRLPLLVDGPRDAPARHRTLRATIAWSHDLLPPAEQRFLASVSVFVGGATLAAIETVCVGCGVDALDAVQSLVDSSLLQVGFGGGEPRYVLLQTVQEYAAEQLAASPQEDAIRRRHADHFLALAEAVEPQLAAGAQSGALRQLEAEYENLQSALSWAVAAGTAEVAVRLAGALGHFWEMTARAPEGRIFLDRALRAPADHAPAARAKGLSVAGTLAYREGDLASATRLHTDALALSRQVGDDEGSAFALNNLAVQASLRADHDTAEDLLRQALRMTSDPRLRAYALGNLAELALARGNVALAVRLHACALHDNTRAGDEWGSVITLYNLGIAHLYLGDLASTGNHLRDSLRRAQALGDRTLVTECLGALATVHVRCGRPALAARLLGAVATQRTSTGAPVPSQDAALHAEAAAQARCDLGVNRFSAEWSAGQAWDLTQAVAAGVSEPARS